MARACPKTTFLLLLLLLSPQKGRVLGFAHLGVATDQLAAFVEKGGPAVPEDVKSGTNVEMRAINK